MLLWFPQFRLNPFMYFNIKSEKLILLSIDVSVHYVRIITQ